MYKRYICPVIIDYKEKDRIEIIPNVYISKMTMEDKITYFNNIEEHL